ncbi:hypothetical protein MSIBF_A3060004 [groundwater metagenome]|uniref:Uncharacterized protein n=1 Tax=groundwater metagenome TaxID=717931 RepID=A0A098ED92_9ZZZZ
MGKKRAMTSEQASYVKRQGHSDTKEFAKLIGLSDEYLNDPKAKKDVIDKSGDSYSVKSGKKKWQIFLYGKKRFENDYSFRAMNGMGQILLKCTKCFPDKRSEYLKNKQFYKNKLQLPMTALCGKLKDTNRIIAFIDKGVFNSGEVNYLAIKHENKFHVFWSRDVVDVLSKNFVVENSHARNNTQISNQKIVFKVDNKTYGEIEMRNDSEVHYREVKFWLNNPFIFKLLLRNIKEVKEYQDRILVYGNAIKKFGRWK